MSTSNFALEVKAILGLESTHLEIRVAKIGLTGPHDKWGNVENCFWGILMATSNFAFEVKDILGLDHSS